MRVEEQAIARVQRRLMPFLLLMYVIAFLDRANVGYAKDAFQASAGISNAAYSMGAGLFFLSYALLEVPSNLILHRVGAKVWMCRIMVTWGLVSMSTIFVSGTTSFYLLRLSLGAAEAGFFPGVILYLTYWFPHGVRARTLGLFYFGAPIALIFGGPLSGMLLNIEGRGGLRGWQWMFLIEGLLAVAVGAWAYWYLDNGPAEAQWLRGPQRDALLARLRVEASQIPAQGARNLMAVIGDRRFLQFALTYCLIQISVYGVVFFLPAEVSKLLGKRIGPEVGMVSAVPWMCALATTFWISRWVDKHHSYRIVGTVVLGVGALAGLAFPWSPPVISFVALCIAASALIAVQPLFWTFPTAYLSGTAAAGGIATINALGNLGGFLAPNLKVWADESYGSRDAGLYLLAGLALGNALLFWSMGRGTNGAWRLDARRRAGGQQLG